MNADPQELVRRINTLERVCREAGIKLTIQRLEIFKEIAGRADHPEAEAIYHGVRRRVPTVSLDTVYRALWLFRDLGLLTTLGSQELRARFDANLSRHHHFVCVRCGKTRDFYSAELDALRLPEAVRSFGSVEEAQVEVRGTCFECLDRNGTGTKITEDIEKEEQ